MAAFINPAAARPMREALSAAVPSKSTDARWLAPTSRLHPKSEARRDARVSAAVLAGAVAAGRSVACKRRCIPQERWAGGGMAVAVPSVQPGSGTITLSLQMSVGDALRELLAKNAVCVREAGEEVFFVKIASMEPEHEYAAKAAEKLNSEDLACIPLAALLSAPRNMPLECLIDSDAEECQLYDMAPVPYASRTVMAELMGRLPWLVALLGFLTVSSAILEYYDELLQKHLIIAFYITALIGCGGNSGSQASALVLQSLAIGDIAPVLRDGLTVVTKEFLVSLGIAVVLAVGVALRIVLFGGEIQDAATVALAMALTVIFSVLFGAVTPLILQRLGTDPAKVSGPLLSTTIDIFGVLIMCVCAQLLESLGILH
mmetsp:Transcript_2941/g.7489  ORF Transcript_2941/g.7489 Transcript_2941/m.7489 type:complete len:374 (-) Transcript_2941:54-1175(-)